MKRRLADFKANTPFLVQVKIVIWLTVQNIVFIHFFVPSMIRVALLRFFGAQIGKFVIIRRGVRVHCPWNLVVGNNCWIGEEAWFINHEKILIGSNVCISQNVVICSSGHDFSSPTLDYKHKAIEIKDGAWVCLKAIVLPGSKVGVNSVISAGEIFAGNLDDSHLYIKNATKPITYKRDYFLD